MLFQELLYLKVSGLDDEQLSKLLRKIGFTSIQIEFHWDGLGVLTKLLDFLHIKKWLSQRGLAPLLRIIAQKAPAI